MQVNPQNPYRGLRRYIVITLCVAAAIPLAFIGGGIYYEYHKSISAKVEAQLSALVLQHKEAIERFLQETRSAMQIVTSLETRRSIAETAVLQKVFASLQKEYHNAFEDLGIIDARGNHLAYIGPYDLRERKYGSARWFKEAMDKQVFISDVFLGFRNIPHFVIAVKQGEGEEAWILRATINAAKFGSLVENVSLGQTGEAFIINLEGLYQTRSRAGGNIMDLMKEDDSSSVDLKAFSGVRIREIESKGRRILRAKTWMKEGRWMLIVQQDVDDAFAELFTTRNMAIVVFILGAMLVGAVAVGTTGLLVRKIEKADQEKKLLDEQLIQSQKLASIGELSAGVAHEINNPLAVIGEEAGWLQDLMKRDSMKNIPELHEFTDSLREIGMQTGRCREITHKLLSFARTMDSVHKDVQINTLIDEVIAMREREASYSNIAFHREYDQNLPPLFSDPSLLRQVILNIVNNAIDAMPKGGTIHVQTRLRTDAPETVVLSIRDTGVGIPQENLNKIFDPFFTTKPPGKGTGLGLSICHGIILKLGGTIGAVSQVGQGTTFSIQLPLEQMKGATPS